MHFGAAKKQGSQEWQGKKAERRPRPEHGGKQDGSQKNEVAERAKQGPEKSCQQKTFGFFCFPSRNKMVLASSSSEKKWDYADGDTLKVDNRLKT
jgi:hypothetical protein